MRKDSSIWFVTAAFLVAVVALSASQWLDRRWTFVEFLDRQWMVTKQEQQRRWLSEEFSPSDQIRILRLRYSNRYEFWMDSTTRKKLMEVLASFEGSVVLNLDPGMVLKDPWLAPMYTLPRVLRNFRNEDLEGSFNDEALQIEAFLGSFVEQKELAEVQPVDCPLSRMKECTSAPRIVAPQDSKYYKSQGVYGSSTLWRSRESLGLLGHQVDTASQFVFELPLKDRVSRLEVPTQVAGAVALAEGCQTFKLLRSGELQLDACSGGGASRDAGSGRFGLKLQDPLPLFFYKDRFREMTLEQLLSATTPFKGLLLIEVIDSSSLIATAKGTLLSPHELLATGVSNIIEKHFPVSSRLVNTGLLLLVTLWMVILFLKSRKATSLQFLGLFFVSLTTVLALDFCLTFVLNYRTEPAEPLAALSFFGVVVLGFVARRDFSERSLVEQAFKGYVSEERLKNLLSGKENLSFSGRRKNLSLLLLDIAHFSQTVRELPIDNVFLFTRRFFSLVDPIIFKYHGVIDKKTGDGLLAFFGDEDDIVDFKSTAHHALMAGLEIQERLKQCDFKDLGIHEPIVVRIGVNSGEVLIGNTGSESHFDYTVLGESVNFTQRLEAACTVGELMLGPRTIEWLKDYPTAAALMESLVIQEVRITPKHETEAVLAYRVSAQ